MPSNPTYPRPFGPFWQRRPGERPDAYEAYDPYGEEIEIRGLQRRGLAIVVICALIAVVGVGLIDGSRVMTRPTLAETPALPTKEPAFEPNPAWLEAQAIWLGRRARALTGQELAGPAYFPVPGSVPGAERAEPSELPREPARVTPRTTSTPRAPKRRPPAMDFASPGALVPEEESVDPKELRPPSSSPVPDSERERLLGVPEQGELPDAGVPDADLPDGDVPDADLPDGDVPDADVPDADLPGEDDFDPNLGF